MLFALQLCIKKAGQLNCNKPAVSGGQIKVYAVKIYAPARVCVLALFGNQTPRRVCPRNHCGQRKKKQKKNINLLISFSLFFRTFRGRRSNYSVHSSRGESLILSSLPAPALFTGRISSARRVQAAGASTFTISLERAKKRCVETTRLSGRRNTVASTREQFQSARIRKRPAEIVGNKSVPRTESLAQLSSRLFISLIASHPIIGRCSR